MRDDLVEAVRAMQEGRTSDNYPGYFALRIERGRNDLRQRMPRPALLKSMTREITPYAAPIAVR